MEKSVAPLTKDAQKEPVVVDDDGERRPDPEVLEKPKRRQFSAAYKLKVLENADRCTGMGELGALLRREGLYHSYLTAWKRQRDMGLLAGLSPKKRGRKIKPVNPLSGQVKKLERENARLQRELEKAVAIIDVQKKISALMGTPLTENDSKRNKP